MWGLLNGLHRISLNPPSYVHDAEVALTAVPVVQQLQGCCCQHSRQSTSWLLNRAAWSAHGLASHRSNSTVYCWSSAVASQPTHDAPVQLNNGQHLQQQHQQLVHQQHAYPQQMAQQQGYSYNGSSGSRMGNSITADSQHQASLPMQEQEQEQQHQQRVQQWQPILQQQAPWQQQQPQQPQQPQQWHSQGRNMSDKYAAEAPHLQRHPKHRHRLPAAGSGNSWQGKCSRQWQIRDDSRNRGSSSPGMPSNSSKLLTAAVARSSSWQQLHQLLQQDGASMNHIHACALLSTTSKLVQYGQLSADEQQQFAEYFVAALQLAFARVQDSAGPREISSMLWAIAKVGLHPGAAWLDAYLQVAASHLPAMNPQDIGLIAWALARFRHQADGTWWQQLLAATQHKMAAFDPQGLSNVLWGLAVLGISPGSSWLAAATAAAQAQISSFQPQGISVLLWAVAKLGGRPHQSWLQAVADAAAVKLRRYKPAELAMLCHALARLQYQPCQQQNSSVEQQLQQPHQHVQDLPQLQQQPGQQQQHTQGQQQQQLPLLQQIQIVSQNNMHCLQFAEAANMVWAMAVMGQQPQQQWLKAAIKQLQATMAQADGKALANACYGLSRLQHCPDEVWWQTMWQHVPRVLGVSQQVAADDVSAAASTATNSKTAGEAMLQIDGGGVACSTDSQAQATLLLSYAKLGVALPPQVMSALLLATQLQLQLQAMNGAEVAAVAMAAAKLHLKPPASWFAALEDAFAVLLQQRTGSVWDQQQQSQQQQAARQVQQTAGVAKQQLCQQQCLLQQQQQGHQQSWQQEPQQRACSQPLMQPKEVANTMFSIARLRYVPSSSLLYAVQQYKQQYNHLLTTADLQQFSRALQSLTDQRRALQQKAQAATVAVADSKQGIGAVTAAQHSAAAAAAATTGIDMGWLPALTSSNGSHGSSSSSSGSNAEDTSSKSSTRVDVDSSRSTGSSTDNSSKSEEYLPYGKYFLHVNEEYHVTVLEGSVAEQEAVAVAGNRGCSSSGPRNRAFSAVMQQALLAAGGFSVAAG